MQKYLTTTHHNVIWFKKAFDANELEMRPPFQRNPVWTEAQQSYLIDTILKEYPIPEVYMQEVIDDTGNQKHIIVDGQQRIRSCLEFIEGKYKLSLDDNSSWNGLNFDELNRDYKKRIYEYSFVVRILPEMPEEQLRSIFQRLNRSVVVLNAQELRHATYWGPFIKLVEQLAEDERWSDLSIFSPNDIRRMLDIEYISEIAIALLHGPQNKKDSLDRWYAAYEQVFDQEHEVSAVFNKVLGEISQVLPDINKTRWRKKSDFYTLFTVLANHEQILPFSSNQRALLREKLLEFSDAVSRYLKDPGQISNPTEEIVLYSRNVERAASDLANRRERSKQLEAVLTDIWQV